MTNADQQADRRKEHKRLSENHYNRSQTLAAWLLATLVTVNTSGAAALIAATQGADRQPAIAFAIGVALAIASGMCSWGEAHAHAGLHYVKSLTELDEEDKRTQRVAEWQASAFALWSPILNVLSLLSFVVGAFWAARVL
jgi:uncharacterized membrane protein